MARLNAPRNAGDSRPSRRNEPDLPDQAARQGWPFAEGSQNHLDDAAAPWPKPSSRPVSSVPPAGTPPA